MAYRSFCFCAGIVAVSTDYCINLFAIFPFLICLQGWLKQKAMQKLNWHGILK
ncbi:MAG: hypothetical protein J7621_13840 [Niastella sp.]|nr:hypothetical protein [Niastella sp.]